MINMNDMNDIKEILSNSFKISTEIRFNVRIHKFSDYNQPNYIDKIMTYLELGIFLTTKHKSINLVEIHTSE